MSENLSGRLDQIETARGLANYPDHEDLFDWQKAYKRDVPMLLCELERQGSEILTLKDENQLLRATLREWDSLIQEERERHKELLGTYQMEKTKGQDA